MDKFTTLTGVAAPLPIVNVDTDMIIPKQYLKTIKRTGLGKGLFAAGYAACFLGAMKFVAGQEKQKVPDDAKVTATVGIGPRSEGGFGLEITLDVSVPGLPRDQAQALVEKAHQVCPYSNATRNNIDVKLNVV